MDERKFRRIPFEAEIQLAVDDRAWSCRLLDIALKGALLECPQALPLSLGTRGNLSLPLAGSEVTLDFNAELVHREGSKLGFRFLQENLETFTHLRTLLELNSGDPDGIRSELLTWLKTV